MLNTDNVKPWTGIFKNGNIGSSKRISIKENYLASIKNCRLQDVHKKYLEEYGYPEVPGE
ncbi:MAG: hypothetical protein KAJ19_09135 [Gammaproteobacteria bacterium]|nr:hypothetical protein [Gammaproteobacteria bacterium]